MAPSRVRIPPSPLAQRPPRFCAHPRRGGRAVECGGLENRYPSLGGSRVQIPPPPLPEPKPMRGIALGQPRRRLSGRRPDPGSAGAPAVAPARRVRGSWPGRRHHGRYGLIAPSAALWVNVAMTWRRALCLGTFGFALLTLSAG